MKDNLTIFVNSCDSYKDCWSPFFSLLKKNWSNCELPIILNTETIVYKQSGLNINCPRVEKQINKNLKWGKRFIETLEYVQTKYVLLILDDFFIDKPVNVKKIYDLIDIMEKENIVNIQLAERDESLTHSTKYDILNELNQEAEYRFNLQVSLWEKDKLKNYIRAHENPWQLEHCATKRAWIIKDKIYCINKKFIEKYGNAISYPLTGGVARGKWVPEVVENILLPNGINVDIESRGLWYGDKKKNIKTKITNKIIGLPSALISLVDLYYLKIIRFFKQ